MVLATIYALLSFTFEGYDLSIYGLLSLVYDTFSSEWFLYIFFGDMGARFLFFYYKIKNLKYPYSLLYLLVLVGCIQNIILKK
jgi:hypothetical protein